MSSFQLREYWTWTHQDVDCTSAGHPATPATTDSSTDPRLMHRCVYGQHILPQVKSSQREFLLLCSLAGPISVVWCRSRYSCQVQETNEVVASMQQPQPTFPLSCPDFTTRTRATKHTGDAVHPCRGCTDAADGCTATTRRNTNFNGSSVFP